MVEKGIANFLRQRQPRGTLRFAHDLHRGLVPVNVLPTQIGNVSGPQPKAGKKKQDCQVASANRRHRIAAGQNALDISRGQVPRQGGQLPAGNGRDGLV
jgi:hypothetical protein